MGEPNLSKVLADGLGDSLHDLPDYLHFTHSLAEQGLEHCPFFPRETRPEHDHSDDGRNLPRILGFLCLDQH